MSKNSLPPLPSDQLKEIDLIMAIAEKNMGFVPSSLKTMARIPALVTTFGTFFSNVFGTDGDVSPWTGIKMGFKNIRYTVKNLKRKDRLPLYLKHLVAYISSNTAGCRYCQAHTIGQAAKAGVAEEKLMDAWNFENSPHFDEAERSALRFAVAASSVPNATTTDHFTDLRKYYSETQIVELGAAIAMFGFLNRWNDTFATELEDEPTAFANRVLQNSGWTKGKH